MNNFVFLFPDSSNIGETIRAASFHDKYEVSSRRFCALLNAAIEMRYRSKGFQINYFLFKDDTIFPKVNVKESDTILNISMSRKVMDELYYSRKDHHVDSNEILSKLDLSGNSRLVVAGFHAYDCVEHLAIDAYKAGIDVLIDEDLTELLLMRSNSSTFCIDTYPSFNPHERGEQFYQDYMDSRKGKPWLCQC